MRFLKVALLTFLHVALPLFCNGCKRECMTDCNAMPIEGWFGCRFDWNEAKLTEIRQNSPWRRLDEAPFIEVEAVYDGKTFGYLDDRFMGARWDVQLFLSPDGKRLIGVWGICSFSKSVFRKGHEGETSATLGERLKGYLVEKYGEPCRQRICSPVGDRQSSPLPDKYRREFGWTIGKQVLKLKYDVFKGGDIFDGECSLEIMLSHHISDL